MPVYVIRGMQLGLGIKLAHKGISSVLYVDGAAGQYRGMAGLDGWLLGCAAVVFILLSTLPREAADAQQVGAITRSLPRASPSTYGIYFKLFMPPTGPMEADNAHAAPWWSASGGIPAERGLRRSGA